MPYLKFWHLSHLTSQANGVKTFFFFFLSSFFFLYCKRLLFQTQNLSLPNHPWPFSSKPKTQKKKKRKKKRISHISLSFTLCVYVSFLLFWSMILSLSLNVCICFLSFSVCVFVSFLLFWSMILSLSLSLSGQNNERGCDDGFVDFKSVEVSGIAENDLFFGLKPNRFGFYFLIFPVWLLRKWWRRVPFLVWNPVDLAFIFWFFDLS